MNTQFKMNSVLDSTNLTLDVGLVMLLGRPDIPHGRKDRVKAAVAKVERLLRKPANQLPAHLPYLMRQISRFKHESGSPQRKTIANTKSEIRFLIRSAIGKTRQSEFAVLSPDWSELRARITKQSILWKLSRFIAYCSVHKVAPHEVNDVIVGNFHTELVGSEDVDKPHYHVRAAIRAWNRLDSVIPNWRGKLLSLPPQLRNRWTIQPANFPESFREDVQRWLDRLGKSDPLGEEGPLRAARPVTIEHRGHQIYKAASALVLSGVPIEDLTSLAILIQPDQFRASLRYLLERQNGYSTEALFGLACALRYVATHHVKAPQSQLDRLRRIAIGLRPEESGLGVRTEQRLEPFEDERLLGALLHLPEHLLRDAEHSRSKARLASLLAQVAIAIEIELLAPIRLKNLARLNIHRNIQIVQHKGKKIWIIRITRQESKNRSAKIHFLPPESVAQIERAMKLYRQTGGWLFPGLTAGAKSGACLSQQIKRTIENRLGVPFNVHAFRGFTASLHLKENPNGFESARAILGDRDDEVIRSSYTRFAERHLIAAAQETILNKRAQTLPGRFPPKGRGKGRGK